MSKHERRTALSMIALIVTLGTASCAQRTQLDASREQQQAQPTQPVATQGPMTLSRLSLGTIRMTMPR
jgi:hypothetical protein